MAETTQAKRKVGRKGKEKRNIRSNKDVLIEVNDILGKELNKDSDCISLYDIVQLISEYAIAYNTIKKKSGEYFKMMIFFIITKIYFFFTS